MTPENYSGVLFGKQETDFIAGVSSPIPEKILLPSGNWDQFRPSHEQQNLGFETSACTVFSALDCIETLFKYYLKNGLIDSENVLWLHKNGYFVDLDRGEVNFSDRYTAQFAEIIPLTGTYQYKSNNALRRGLIPEAMLPYTDKGEYKNPDNTPGGYFNRSALTTEMSDLAAEFAKRFTINWHWVENAKTALWQSPLQAVVKFANGEGILKPEGNLNHAIMVFYEESDHDDIDDSYLDRTKRYGKNYVFSFIGYSLTINTQNTMDTIKFCRENDQKFVRNFNTGQFGRVLKGKLRPVTSIDRGTLMLLDNEHRKNGVTVTDAEWKQLPKENF